MKVAERGVFSLVSQLRPPTEGPRYWRTHPEDARKAA